MRTLNRVYEELIMRRINLSYEEVTDNHKYPEYLVDLYNMNTTDITLEEIKEKIDAYYAQIEIDKRNDKIDELLG